MSMHHSGQPRFRQVLSRGLGFSAVMACVGCMGTKPEQREPTDEAYILPIQMKAKLDAPAIDNRTPNPIKLASNLPNASGSKGLSVQNSFDRRTVATANTEPTTKPPVNALPDTGINSAAYVSAPTQPTSSGNLTLQPRSNAPIQQPPPIQIVKNEQPAPVLTAPNPPIKIVGTTSEQTLQPAPAAAIVVAQPQTPPDAKPIVVTPPVAAPIAAPELPKPVAIEVVPPVATPSVVPASPAATVPVVNPVVATPATPPLSVVESGQLLPLTSPLDSRPSGFGK